MRSTALLGPAFAGVLTGILVAASPTATDGPLSFEPTVVLEQFRTRSLAPTKLSPDLAALYLQSTVDGGAKTFDSNQLRDRFGLDDDDDGNRVSVMVRLAQGEGEGIDLDALRTSGLEVTAVIDGLVFGSVPIVMLPRLAHLGGVEAVVSLPITPGPEPIDGVRGAGPELIPMQAERSLLPPDFGVRGEGVIIGIIDSGIDFAHPDFRDELGLSRILGLYDVHDQSWSQSQGKIGTEPPQRPIGRLPGTVYTQFQINEALLGRGTVNHRDTDGHGTLVAGVAAGNGRGVAGGVDGAVGLKYRGVAPHADLLIVAAQVDGRFPDEALVAGIEWIVDEARLRNRPVVINMSLGGQGTMKDGRAPVEQVIDRVTGPGKSGVAVVVAAGNHGRYSLHAQTRFGAKRAGQLDTTGEWVQVSVLERTPLLAIFQDADNFGLGIQGVASHAGAPLVAADGAPQAIFLNNPQGRTITWGRSGNLTDEDVQAFVTRNSLNADLNPHTGEVMFGVMLDPGQYLVWGFGAGPTVPHGVVSFYLPSADHGSFGRGTLKERMVASPGNASSAITVGSYDFRSRWQARDAQWLGTNVAGGDLSAYSNPGFRRDGIVKPDITAPGRWAISAFSSHATVPAPRVVDSGMHLAWDGTSASAPYVAGVIALMLQHDPTLDVERIRQIIAETAIEDDHTGAVPNSGWGHGKINAAMAIGRAQSSRPRTGAASTP